MVLTIGFVLASILALASAGASQRSDTTLCYTQLASTSTPYSTLWETSYMPCTVTSTKTTKVHGKPSVATSTSTSLVTETNRQTATKTATSLTTVLTTSYSDILASSTATVYETSTSTVPASPGFVPIQDSLPGAFWTDNGGPDPIQQDTGVPPSRRDVPEFPRKVVCEKWTASPRCSTVYTTTTTTLPGTKSTIIKTVTSIVVPSAKTTITQVSTSSVTSVVLATTTSIPTITSATSTTVYEACAPTNLADIYSFPNTTLLGFADGYGNYDSLTQISGPDSAYTCCVAALLLPASVGYAAGYGWRLDTTPGQCVISVSDDAGCTQATVQLNATVGNHNWVYGNADCGQWTYAYYDGNTNCGSGGFCDA